MFEDFLIFNVPKNMNYELLKLAILLLNSMLY